MSFLLQGCFWQKCRDQPTYSLCAEQLEWFRPADEIWKFSYNGLDTLKAKMYPVERGHYARKNMFSKCPGPLIERATQQIHFYSDHDLQLPIDLADHIVAAEIDEETYACKPIRYFYGGEDKNITLDSVRIRNVTYYKVEKSFHDYVDGNIYSPDTIFYSKEKGILRMQYVEKNVMLERL